MPRRISYWEGSPQQWNLITKIQETKRDYINSSGYSGPIFRSDDNVIINPVTGQEVPKADLEYAAKHMSEIYQSGMIREDRWAFLWYH